jgi:GNAT superfamily N-acetyltransferase
MKFWTSLIHYTHYHGKLNTNKDCNACACWLPPNKTEMTVLTLLQTFFKIPLSIIQFPAEKKWHAIDIFNYLGEHQKKCITKPHWYLMQLAVAPEYQGKGIGSALIQPVLQHADNNNLECYLETETELNVKFYRKNGFFVENEFLIPKYNLHFYAMIRKPNN